MKHPKQSILSKDGISYLIPFVLITSCFALWGFANDITNPDGKGILQDFPDECHRRSIGAGCLLWRVLCNGFPGCHIHP